MAAKKVKKVSSKKYKRVDNITLESVTLCLMRNTTWSGDKIVEKLSKMFEVSPTQVARVIDKATL